MILDSSAVYAILMREPAASGLLAHISDAPTIEIGAPTLAECGIVISARIGVIGRTLLSRFLEEASVRTLSFSDEHWPVSVDAYRRFGKGRHAAALNFGDCLTYATARLAGGPLLCVGQDFTRTDLEVVSDR